MTNKDLLKQYVDTGLRLSQHQVESLPPNLFKTYIRKRLIAVGHIGGHPLEEYEFVLMPKDLKNEVIKKRIIESYKGFEYRIKKWEYDEMPEDIKITYLKNIFKIVITGKYKEILMLMMGGTNAGRLEQWEYEDIGRYLGREYQKKYALFRVKNDANLEMWEFDGLDHKEKIAYINKMERAENPFYDFSNRLGEDRYFKLMGRKLSEKPNKYNRDWDIPKPPQEVNQVYESLKRHKQIISYGN